MPQVVFSSVSKEVINILSKRGTDGISAVYLFDVWYFDEIKRKMKEETATEVTSYLDIAKLKYSVLYLDITRKFYEIVIDIASRVNCKIPTIFYLVPNELIVNLALYYFALLCKNKKIFDRDGKEILSRLPERVSEAQLEVLHELKEEKEVEELARTLGKSLSTLSQQISALEEKGLVACTETRPKKCVATELGKMLIALG